MLLTVLDHWKQIWDFHFRSNKTRFHLNEKWIFCDRYLSLLVNLEWSISKLFKFLCVERGTVDWTFCCDLSLYFDFVDYLFDENRNEFSHLNDFSFIFGVFFCLYFYFTPNQFFGLTTDFYIKLMTSEQKHVQYSHEYCFNNCVSNVK